jgi:hypothetical protein
MKWFLLGFLQNWCVPYIVIFLEHFIFDGCKNESCMVVRIIMKIVIKLLIDVLDLFWKISSCLFKVHNSFNKILDVRLILPKIWERKIMW